MKSPPEGALWLVDEKSETPQDSPEEENGDTINPHLWELSAPNLS